MRWAKLPLRCKCTVFVCVKTVSAAALILGEDTHRKTSVPKAPTKDEASLKAYTARRKLNKLRRDACHLFTSETMVKAIKKLEAEIETGRLLVRRDRHLWKDVGKILKFCILSCKQKKDYSCTKSMI